MPEIKHNFTGGRMNKDLDERLVPNGEYRDAMNIQVSTSEGSEVGTVQNILGNILIQDGFTLSASAIVVGSITDEKIDTLYYLIWSPEADYILSYKRNDELSHVIFKDLNKNVLRFDPNNIVTGINVIDDMLFWTDNHTEPKKINIPRCKAGTISNSHTKLINEQQGIGVGANIDIEEKHITVIKKTPPTPLEMRLITNRLSSLIYTGVITIGIDTGGGSAGNTTSFQNTAGNSTRYNFSGLTTKPGSNTFNVQITEGVDSSGNVISIGDVGETGALGLPGLTGWHDPAYSGNNQGRIPAGQKIVFKPFDDDGSPPGLPVTSYVLKGVVEDAYNNPGADGIFDTADDPGNNWATTYSKGIKVRITSIDGFPPIPNPSIIDASGNSQTVIKYVVDLFDETEKLFEFKFPRFSYRYKYEDGEYSPFAPFTQVAFSPGSFDYHPRKGYNLGMTNKLSQVKLGKFINANTPKDVVSVDILFKDEPSPNVYIVETISPNDSVPSGAVKNKWEQIKTGSTFDIDKETISSVTPSNQMLRPWDNVPRKALAQDVTGNRVVYGNYVQNYNLTTKTNKKYSAEFNCEWREFDPIKTTDVGKSIKSLREYQLGVVFTDKYGRETPVISNPTGTKKLQKPYADKNNRLEVEMLGNEFPSELTHFKFFVKETADQYYNMAMDRWYSAEDGNIWLAFPSSDRNKIDIDTFLILKKGTDADALVVDPARYKVIAIENEAPDFIKTSKTLIFGGAGTAHNSANTSKKIFEANANIIPKYGSKNFTMRYEAFSGTTGQNLDAIEEDLYVEFGFVGKNEVSNRYKISSITNDYSRDITGAAEDVVDITSAIYSIQLEESLGIDVNFISDSPLGGSISKIEDGAIVNIYKYKVENKPQFDGRFFVKIYYDDVFQVNISSTTEGATLYNSSQSKKIYGISGNHVNQHTVDVGHFLVNGNKTVSNNNNWDFGAGNPSATFGKYLTGTEQAWGYYLDDVFSSFALYFRRYEKGDKKSGFCLVNQANTTGTFFGGTLSGIVSAYPYQPLKNLKKGGSIVLYEPDDQAWMNETHWKKEFGDIYDNTYGQTANFDFKKYQASLSILPLGYVYVERWYGSGAIGGSNTDEGADNPKETEVWFLDKGPRKGRVEDNFIDWPQVEQGHVNLQNNGNITSSVYNTSIHSKGNGINMGSSEFTMELGFGGIGKVKTPTIEDNFFNVGDWFIPNNEAVNTEYNNETWPENFAIGSLFRWAEDPQKEKNIYIVTNATAKNYTRHSSMRSVSATKFGIGSSEVRALVSSDERIGQAGALTTTFPNDANNVPSAMAQGLSFNFTKNWTLTCKALDGTDTDTKWNPGVVGEIDDALVVRLKAKDINGGTAGVTANGTAIGNNLVIYVSTLTDNNDLDNITTLQKGMVLSKYEPNNLGGYDRLENNLTQNKLPIQEFLVVRHIVELSDSYELWLGGYSSPLHEDYEHRLAADNDYQPKADGNYKFTQAGTNGYSPNSEFNINTMGAEDGNTVGKVGAVGYTLEFLNEVEPEEFLSENPAIWETEPKDVKDLDIYYETTGAIPMDFDASNIHEAFPVGSIIDGTHLIVGYDDDYIVLNNLFQAAAGYYEVTRPDGLNVEVQVLGVYFWSATAQKLKINPLLYNSKFLLPWYNCYSFGNGVESNRIRDNFNLPYIANGVKVSTTLEQEYKEEHRKYGLIYSGLYNSTSGVNNLNQFIAAEKITKDVNPIYGSIQKLHSRDTDLVTLCEDKCLRILANKDAVFNADGNTNLTATSKVLGQTFTFSGEYGISTNPESFASESYRVYFTDKVRGTVMRLSKDGLTPISNHGMKDWFKDNLRLSNRIIGSHDDRKEEYNLTLKHHPSIWILGEEMQVFAGGPIGPPTYFAVNSIRTSYATAKHLNIGDIIKAHGIPSGTTVISKTQSSLGSSTAGFDWKINLDLPTNSSINTNNLGNHRGYGVVGGVTVYWETTLLNNNLEDLDKTVSFKEDVKGWVSFKSFTPENAISMANDYYTFLNGELFKHHVETVDRNTFYGDFASSTVDVVLNDNPSYIKEFTTLNYEGSQSKVEKFVSTTETNFDGSTSNYNDQEYYNLSAKDGWHVDSIITNDEDGHIDEFLEKEGKWFNYIKREIDLKLNKADTGDFSFQGIGFADNIGEGETIICDTCQDGNPVSIVFAGSVCPEGSIPTGTGNPCGESPVIYGCTDSTATNYNGEATIDNGSCVYDVYGCMNSTATNYDPQATVDDGSCNYVVIPPVTCDTVTGGQFEGCDDWNNVMNGTSVNTLPYITTHWYNLLTAEGYNTLANGQPFTFTNLQLLLGGSDGCCGEPVSGIQLGGCMDATAQNYSSLATFDDGSCCFQSGCWQ